MTGNTQYDTLYDVIGIYKIENKINGKKYIGRSIDIGRRWQEEKNGQVNSHLLRAFVKYGIENFDFSVIEECKVSELSEKETFYIKKFKSNHKLTGYNKTLGGEGGLLGYTHTEETKIKMSEAAMGKKNHNYGKPMHHNTDIALHSKKGKDHPCYGKKRPREIFKTKMKPVVCIETGVRYDCGTDAARAMNLSSSNLAKSLKNPKRTFGGYHWEYVEKE